MMAAKILWLLLFCSVSAVIARDATSDEKHYIDAYKDHHGDKKPEIIMDEAWMTVNNSLTFDVLLYAYNHECWKCDILYIDRIPSLTLKTFVVNTTFGTDIEIRQKSGKADDDAPLCRFAEHFKENGDYWLFTEADGNSTSCSLVLANDPMVAEMPILYVAAGLVGLWIIIKIVFLIYRKSRTRKKEISNGVPGQAGDISLSVQSEKPEEATTTHNKRQRLKSLDTFRGLSLIIMIFVNYGGGGYWFFDHPPWNGLTVADLVFPWFVFIMGSSMNYSFRSMFKRGKSRPMMLFKVLKRSVLLFAFGIILNTNWGPVDLDHIRIPGVLQRLSLSYLVVALMETAFARREDTHQNKRWAPVRDLVLYIPEWIISLGILAAHLALTFALHVPDCPTGYIGPGGLHDGKKYENCTGGAAGYIDRLVLGDNHIYGNPTPKKIYQTKVPYDPEGILGTLTSIFLCFLGLQAGRIFVTYKDTQDRILRLIIWSAITGAIGAGLCECSKNDGVIPLNKNLWSVSFILLTACFGYTLLCVLFVVIDVFKLWNGTPFIFSGMNPLLIYLCHDIFYRFFPVNWQVDPVHWKLLLKAVWDVAIWVTLAFVLYCKKVFIAL